LFDAQPRTYREEVLPAGEIMRVAVEAGIGMGWERYVGTGGMVIGMEGFGASAPAGDLMEKFGFTGKHIVARIKAAL
jgi:transketolase